MGWFESVKNPKLKNNKKSNNDTPTGLWKKCTSCNEILQSSKLEENVQICPYCSHHFRLSAKERLELLIDEGTFKYFEDNLQTTNPLDFNDRKDYGTRLEEAKGKTNKNDGTIYGVGKINKKKVALGIMNFQFMGGSMGVVTGEKIARVFDQAYKENIPAIIVSASGGARMQEGILSLMQMGKTSAARQKLKNKNIPYISILTDPTTGGVAASFAMLGDLNIAEPKALIGFAGPRVIEQSIRQKLPEGFQRSEFLQDHGFIDLIVDRRDLKDKIDYFLTMFDKK